MICDVCHRPTAESTSAYSEALQRRVCFACIRSLRMVERYYRVREGYRGSNKTATVSMKWQGSQN